MNQVSYTLRAGYQGKTFIQLSFTHQAGRFRKSMGVQCEAHQWSIDKQRVLATHPRQYEVNRLLDISEKLVMDAHFKAMASGIRLTDAMLAAALSPGSVPRRKVVDFKAFWLGVVESRVQDGRFAHQTIKNMRSCLNILVDYERYRRTEIHFDMIDKAFLEDFRQFLVKKREHGQNTISKHFRMIATVLNIAVEQGIPIKTDFQTFRVGELPAHNIYLSLDELNRLAACDLPERLRRAADIFLIGCFTALRYSDFSRFRVEHIRKVRGVDMIFIKQQKTGDDVVIPMHPVVHGIIGRYGGLPRMISAQKLNVYVKEACRLAGITDSIVHYFNQGGKNLTSVVQKWELVSSHTARRSCATNMHIAGIDSKLIMKLTGHRKESTFMKYLCIDNEEAALLLSRSGFFKP